MDPDAAWTIIEEQRRSLADLLEELTEDQWETRSLCADGACATSRSATTDGPAPTSSPNCGTTPPRANSSP
jgi:hypothetical protein